ncbi:hypothetical protein AK830_g10096 [Neonectria ditissima]|uniref:Peptidase S9 prolyl oligopeptidase catalytic domain-containing protein n=1 Tax=Neonectria ditissima TaxID=78410 RepID=A0A0P7AQR2_9HYPO|nr:hypothetical protein AK830_g10096 [Neonectria ditissima]
MASKKIAPYGSWESPISVDSVVSKNRRLSSPRASAKSGRAFYTESREAGGTSIIEVTKDGLTDILPAEYSANNSVYEYGGSTYAVLPDDRIIFSNKDNAVRILNPENKEVSLLTGSPKLRYSDFDSHPEHPWVLANEEDHEEDTPSGVRNYIVAINTATGQVKRILDSADFYYTPYFSPDGTKLVWLEWNHPDLPFDAAKLYSATWKSDSSISDINLIAGETRESVAEPRWGPDGSLFFGKETKGYRRLFRVLPGQALSHTYAPLSERYLVASPVASGVSQVTLIDLDSGSWRELANASILSEIMLDSVARLDDSSFLVIGSGTAAPQTLYRFQVGETVNITSIRKSTEESFPKALCSVPESLAITAGDAEGRRIHGFLWLPHNPDFDAPQGDLPPLIMVIHGGPTAYTGPGLKVRTQYFTSRGYAVLGLNHAGSSGHGRQYREALFGNWGLVDSDDAAEFAEYLVATQKVRPGAAGITGGSAGGYNTLQTLARHPKTFAAGVCISGVSDVKLLDESTHKLESDYMDHLLLPPDSSEADKKRIYRERSPRYHVDRIESPLLLLHGGRDKVTPLEQAQYIADAIKAKGGDVKIIVAPDEGHGFSRPQNVRLWLEEEEKWWQRTLL